ncbi:NAD(P)H-dependent oxidoreductase subunit E [Nitrosococcus wardiae]|uniref:NAD(P)H-dependent oxidoreductase subunit E n=1 Tax=Nitrosococcus wardiae TaxID=1814290 RepID=UPI001F106013|nr:NAD(P)H-dependent oxidoreductase subunit E [Nitrosococcus wardiae]
MSKKSVSVPRKGRALRKARPIPKGRQVNFKTLEEIRALLGESPRQADLLIEFLHQIQDAYHHISAAHIAALASELKLSQTQVYEVATFYHHFDVTKEDESPPPPLTVRVCDSVTCEMWGAKTLIAELEAVLGEGVRVQKVPCVGRCDQAPVAVVGMHSIGRASVDKVTAAVAADDRSPDQSPSLSYAEYCQQGGYQLWRDCMAGHRDPEFIISMLEESGLRGLGGAGFPAGRKWRIVRQQPAPRLMAVNIDEGEPGTFKDRYYLERDPHRFLEGTFIAAWAVGIDEIFLYLRDEYAGCRQLLERELALVRANPPCQLPQLHLLGGGGLVCTPCEVKTMFKEPLMRV